MAALLELHKTRFTEIYDIDDAVRRDPELAAVVAAVDAKTAGPFDVGCQSPGWVAARLWESIADDGAQSDLLQWLAKWHDLGSPNITPLSVWSPENASRFIDAALDAIEANLSDDGWSLLNEDIIRRDPSFATRISPVPQAPLDRLAWLERLHYTHDRIGEDSLILHLVGAVLHQIAAVEHVGVPHPHADRLFELALGRPAVLHTIAAWCSSLPVLLADLVVNSSLSALACALIGEQANRLSNALSFAVADNSDRDRENAFSDAVTVLSFLYEKGRVAAADVASLFTWVLREHGAPFADRRGPLLRRLRSVVEEIAPERVQAVVAALEGSGEFVLATSEYVAALELLGATSIINTSEPALFLDGYLDALRRGDYGLSVRHVSEGAAAVIVRVAAAETAGSPVLGPPADLFTLTPSDEPDPSEYAEEGRRARAVRAHVRVLCRALSRVEGGVRKAAVDALVSTVRYGARSKGNGGIVGAFTARYEVFPQADNDRPIAQDLASALELTNDDDGARLLDEIIGIDEPYMLAQLHTLVRPELRTQLAARVSRLGPDEAASIDSYTEMQLRIDALLNAGLVAQAQAFVDAERDIQTRSAIPGAPRAAQRAWRREKIAVGPTVVRGPTAKPAHLETTFSSEGGIRQHGLRRHVSYAPLGDGRRVFGSLFLGHTGSRAYRTNRHHARHESHPGSPFQIRWR